MSKKEMAEVSCSSLECVYVHKSWAISDLEGKMLTFIDAAISDPTQRKALKDLLRPSIWRWAIESDMSSYYEMKNKVGSGK